MRLFVITICKNEARTLPFFIRHYQQWVDGFFFFDNDSNDGTREIIEATPNAEYLPFDSLGYYKVEVHTMIKSKAYQQLRLGAHWYFIVDCDEYLYHPDMRAYLERCAKDGVSVPRTLGYQMYSKHFPADDGQSQLTELVPNGLRDTSYDKPLVVHKDARVQYTHFASALGEGSSGDKYSQSASIKLLRYNWQNMGLGLKGQDYDRLRNKDFSEETSKKIPSLHRSRRALNYSLRHTYACLASVPVLDFTAFQQRIQSLFTQASQDPEAAFSLALLALREHVQGLDPKLWLDWLRKAAQAQYGPAMYELAHLLNRGHIVNEDRVLAAQIFCDAGKQGHFESAVQAGVMLGQVNPSKAIEFLHLACDYEDPIAAYHLFLAYRDGNGCTPNEEQSIRMLGEAADGGFPDACFNYALHWHNRAEYERAFPYFLKDARMGGLESYQVLKMYFQQRKGIPQNLDASLEWFRLRMRYSIYDI